MNVKYIKTMKSSEKAKKVRRDRKSSCVVAGKVLILIPSLVHNRCNDIRGRLKQNYTFKYRFQ